MKSADLLAVCQIIAESETFLPASFFIKVDVLADNIVIGVEDADLGFAVTRRAIDDNLIREQIPAALAHLNATVSLKRFDAAAKEAR